MLRPAGSPQQGTVVGAHGLRCTLEQPACTPWHCLTSSQCMFVRMNLYVYVCQVFMGTGLVYHLGQLEYVDSSSSTTSLSASLLIYLAGGVGGAILVVVFIIIILFMRKSRQSARAVKRMRNQMDVLEARVAKECKEGQKNTRPKLPFFSFIETFYSCTA